MYMYTLVPTYSSLSPQLGVVEGSCCWVLVEQTDLETIKLLMFILHGILV